MKITAQEEYGLRCLLQLARAPRGELVSVKAIAEKEGLSNANVEKLLRLLAQAGLVHSVRGINGGYVLNRPPEQVRLSEVVRALGTLPSTTKICQDYTGNRSACVHFDDCSLRSVWSSMTRFIQHFLDQTTLAMLLENEYGAAETMTKSFGRPPLRIEG
jgi:Rrf2 family protein